MNLTGKAALITGGGRGIGKAIALELARAGADVAVCARSLDEVEAVAAEIRALGRASFALRCDVADASAAARAVDEAASQLCRLDILVNELVPGPVITKLTEDTFQVGTAPPIADSERVKLPEECAPLALFLAAHPPGGPTGQSFSLARRPL